VPLQLEPDETPLRMLAALGERLLADVAVVFRLRHREANAGLERVDLVVELRTREHEPRLDPEHVERLEPERRDVTGREHRVPELRRVLRVAEELVAELA